MKTKAVSVFFFSPMNINNTHCLCFHFMFVDHCFPCKLWDGSWCPATSEGQFCAYFVLTKLSLISNHI